MSSNNSNEIRESSRKRELSISKSQAMQNKAPSEQIPPDTNQKQLNLSLQSFFYSDFVEYLDEKSEEKKEIFMYNQIYALFKIPLRIEKLFFINFLIQLQALIFNMVVMPIRVLIMIVTRPFNKWKFTERRQLEFARVFIIITTSYLLTAYTNSSVIYHWIRGQSLFKLYMIKAVMEISDLLFKGFGHAMLENLSRDFYSDTAAPLQKILDVLGMVIYVTLHSFILIIEMFTLHVAINSNGESVLSFVFYNNFTELKITVFKKVDIPGLYQYAANDSVERFQLFVYILNIIMTTSQDMNTIMYYTSIIYISEIAIDTIKHFFITRLNRLRNDIYIEFKNQIYKDFMIKQYGITEFEGDKKSEDQTHKVAYKFYNAALIDKVFDLESSLAMQSNFLVLPQICLIIRNSIDYFNKNRTQHIYTNIILIFAFGLLMRYVIKKTLTQLAFKNVIKVKSQ